MAESATPVKLFGKWSLDDLEVSDLALVDFIGVKGKHATFVAHTAGKYQRKRFRKAQVSSPLLSLLFLYFLLFLKCIVWATVSE